MNREKAKQLLPIIQAYAEGKTIQTKRIDGTWVDFEPQISKDIGINFENGEHRIKPEENFNDIVEADHSSNCKDSTNTKKEEQIRPFKDCDELVDYLRIPAFYYTKDCKDKLSKPNIWVKNKEYRTDNLITVFDSSRVYTLIYGWINMKELFDNFTFLDGSPCGKEIS